MAKRFSRILQETVEAENLSRHSKYQSSMLEAISELSNTATQSQLEAKNPPGF